MVFDREVRRKKMKPVITKSYAKQIGIKEGDLVHLHVKYLRDNGTKRRIVFFEKHPSGHIVKLIKTKVDN